MRVLTPWVHRDELGREPLSPRGRGGTYALVAAILVAAVAAAAPAFANRVLRSGDGRVSSSLGIRASESEQRVALTTTWGQRAAVWSADAADGRHCTFVQVDDASASAPAFDPRAGGVCGGTPSPDDPLSVRLSWVPKPGSGVGIVVSGTAAPNIARVSLAAAGLADTPVRLRDGYFVGELGSTRTGGTLPRSSGTYFLRGYDQQGAVRAELDLSALVASARAAP